MNDYLSIGPPAYFIVKDTPDFNYSSESNQNWIKGGFNPYSLVSQIFSASRASNETYIAKPVSSWLDDYADWVGNSNCCKYNKTTKGFCPNFNSKCATCHFENDPATTSVMTDHDFEKYVSWFLKDNPTDSCPKGGHAAYGQGVNLRNVNESWGMGSRIGANYFMTYHTILKTSQDYTNALKEARVISHNLTKTLREGNF